MPPFSSLACSRPRFSLLVPLWQTVPADRSAGARALAADSAEEAVKRRAFVRVRVGSGWRLGRQGALATESPGQCWPAAGVPYETTVLVASLFGEALRLNLPPSGSEGETPHAYVRLLLPSGLQEGAECVTRGGWSPQRGRCIGTIGTQRFMWHVARSYPRGWSLPNACLTGIHRCSASIFGPSVPRDLVAAWWIAHSNCSSHVSYHRRRKICGNAG